MYNQIACYTNTKQGVAMENIQMKTNENNKSQRNILLDIFKYILAFFIISIHFQVIPNLVAFSRFAVPCFFILSGFFLCKKNPENAGGGILRDIKNFLPYIVVLYTVQLIDFIATKQFRDFIGISWYVPAYFFTRIYYIYICKYNLQKLFFCLIPALLIGNLMLGSCSSLIFSSDIPLVLSRNSIFTGLPFFLIGVLIRKSTFKINKFFAFLIIILGILILLIQINEFHLVKTLNDNVGDVYISTIIGSSLLVYGLTKFKINCSKYIVEKLYLDKVNFGIYMFHTMLGIICQSFLLNNLFSIYCFSFVFAYFFAFIVDFANIIIKRHNFFQKN